GFVQFQFPLVLSRLKSHLIQCCAGVLPPLVAIHAPREILVKQSSFVWWTAEIIVWRNTKLFRIDGKAREYRLLRSKAGEQLPLKNLLFWSEAEDKDLM